MKENNNSGTMGILSGLNVSRTKEEKNLRIKEENNSKIKEFKEDDIEDFSIKRSYSLRPSTNKKLRELKLLADEDVTYNEIINRAICELYDRREVE